jgi:hypothetical protein
MSDDSSWGTDEEAQQRELASVGGTVAEITEPDPGAPPAPSGGPHQHTEVGGHLPVRSSESTGPTEDQSPAEHEPWASVSGTIDKTPQH